ncbi:MAG: hypothetical protein R3F11_01760 [Verrucomicrobiales bacterium]
MKRLRKYPRVCLAVLPILAAIVVYGYAEDRSAEAARLDALQMKPAGEFTKIIDQTRSPNKRFAVAVGSADGKLPAWEEINSEDVDGASESSFVLDQDDCANYLVDLQANRVRAILGAAHFGTRNHYNHESFDAIWSPDCRWFVEEQNWKWNTGACNLYRLSADGVPEACLDLKTAAEEVVAIWIGEHAPNLPIEDRGRYAITIDAAKISNGGVLEARITAQIPKAEEAEIFDLTVIAAISAADSGELSLKATELAPYDD